ncbi:MAG TPA: YIP1 family protein [Longimicrobiaceae bacterium]|nr:YIP1 family protein [Longimicrobiaceae bacterium]
MESSILGTTAAVPLARPSLLRRVAGAAMLRAETYREVATDGTATKQAVGIVSAVGLSLLAGAFSLIPTTRVGTLTWMLLWALITAYGGWMIWSSIAYLSGRILRGRAGWQAVLRAVAFAAAPGLLIGPGFLLFALSSGVLGQSVVDVLLILVGCWLLLTDIVAVREAMDMRTGKAVVATLAGGAGFVAFASFVLMIFEIGLFIVIPAAGGV